MNINKTKLSKLIKSDLSFALFFFVLTCATSFHANSDISKTQNIESTPAAELVSKSCPNEFNGLSIPFNSKLCQVFATDYPASMVFYVPEIPEMVVKNYMSEHPYLREVKDFPAQTMIQSSDKNTTLVISADGQGSQVDILIKQPLS